METKAQNQQKATTSQSTKNEPKTIKLSKIKKEDIESMFGSWKEMDDVC